MAFQRQRKVLDAKIEDEAFWSRIDQGEEFAEGDRLKVHLRTTARRNPHGVLKVERRIPTVIEVEHSRRKQAKLFRTTLSTRTRVSIDFNRAGA